MGTVPVRGLLKRSHLFAIVEPYDNQTFPKDKESVFIFNVQSAKSPTDIGIGPSNIIKSIYLFNTRSWGLQLTLDVHVQTFNTSLMKL